MSKIEVEIRKDLSEAVPYDAPGIPLYIRTRMLSDYVNMRSFPHWHDEIEIMYIQKGRLNFNVDGKNILLEENDGIILNCKQMHHSSSFMGQDCVFFCILFHPGLFTGNPSIHGEYVGSVIKNPDFEYCLIDSRHPFHNELFGLINAVTAYKQEAAWGYEMKIIGTMHIFWSEFVCKNGLFSSESLSEGNPEARMQRDMLSFIHQHYMNRITLSDIAAAGNICRSKCCLIFKRYMNCSPIEFLNQYRLETSCKLLENKDLSITEIAGLCGFVHSSYYSQMFRRIYGLTPREYRELLSEKRKISFDSLDG